MSGSAAAMEGPASGKGPLEVFGHGSRGCGIGSVGWVLGSAGRFSSGYIAATVLLDDE